KKVLIKARIKKWEIFMLCIINAVKINMNSGGKDNVHGLIKGIAFLWAFSGPCCTSARCQGLVLV
ncbi:MAG: hypothetical protein KA166_09190, partial [Saprospiraceae bacterium]|nr:hypothetical protein [Saprospiraceae bacterium]